MALLLAGGALWLFVAAVAVYADGGPHIAAVNNGSGGLTSDNCAGCHRAHTAPAADLLRVDVSDLCLACHNGDGATVDVVDGLQYVPTGGTAADPTHDTLLPDSVLGALRGGGFTYALIDSSHPARLIASGRFLGTVRVLGSTAKQPATSTHLGTGTVWGNGPDGTVGAGAGPANLACTSCHNPHGNGQYRILRPAPGEDWDATDVPGWTSPTNRVEVADIPNPLDRVRNYTILPVAFAGDASVYLATQGDYWRLRAPWNLNTGLRDPMQVGWDGLSPTNAAGNGGVPPANSTGLMTAWCIQCHTRYNGLVNADGESSSVAPQPDVIFTYRHLTMNYGCEQCHVSHGSNALMDGPFSLAFTDPAGAVPRTVDGAGPAASPTTSGDSRLLKVDNRGTCQLCHDPTHTVSDSYSGPTPTPGVP